MVAWRAYACRLLDPGKGIASVPAGQPPAEAARPSGSSWAADDVLPALTRRAADLEARIASIEAELQIEQQRIASYAEHGRSLEAALADAYRAAHAIRARARSDADRILAHAVEERRMLFSDIGRLREEQVGLEDEITSLRRDRLVSVPPSYEFAEPPPAFDLQASIAEEMRLLLVEIVEEFRARPLLAKPEIAVPPPRDGAEKEIEEVPETPAAMDVVETEAEELYASPAAEVADAALTTEPTLEDWDEMPSAQALAPAPEVEVSAEPADQVEPLLEPKATTWTEVEEGVGAPVDAVGFEPDAEPTLEDWDEMPSALAPAPVTQISPEIPTATPGEETELRHEPPVDQIASQVAPPLELEAPSWTEVEEGVGSPIERWDEMPSAQAPAPDIEISGDIPAATPHEETELGDSPPVDQAADQRAPPLELEAPSWTEVEEAIRLRIDALTSEPNVEPALEDWDETPAAESISPAHDVEAAAETSTAPIELTPEPWSPVDDEVVQIDSPMPSWTEPIAEPDVPVPPPSWNEVQAEPVIDPSSEIERSEPFISPWDEVEIAPAASAPTDSVQPLADFAPALPLEADLPQEEMLAVPVEPVAPPAAAPQSDPAPRQIGLVVSPVHSFPHLLEIQRRVQSLSSVRGLQLRDFRNGVATFAVGVAESITPREFGAVVQMLENLKLRLEDASENSVELRVEDAPSSG